MSLVEDGRERIPPRFKAQFNALFVALGLALSASAAASAEVSGLAGTIIVTNKAPSTATVIDVASRSVLRHIAGGESPDGIVYTTRVFR